MKLDGLLISVKPERLRARLRPLNVLFEIEKKNKVEIPQALFVEIASGEEDGGFDAQNVRV